MKLLTKPAKSIFFTIFACALVSTFSTAQAKPYSRVVVFPGGGLQTAMFLGELQALEEENKNPDLVIGTCGGSIAALIAHNFSTSLERKNFMESKEYFEALKKTKIVRPSLGSAIGDILEMVSLGNNRSNHIPDIFKKFVMHVPRDLGMPSLNKSFESKGIRALIVASEMNFGPENVGQERTPGKLHKETYFTDTETAKHLQGIRSATAQQSPNSFIENQTQTITDVSVLEATRAAITDPYYIEPLKIKNKYYLTGAINLYPIELAKELGDEVFIPFTEGFDTVIEQNAMQSIFGFDNNERLRFVTSQKASHWVDFSDSGEYYAKYGFNPKPSILSFSIEERIPSTHEEYVKKVNGLWAYGYERMKEALKKDRGSQAHIREKSVENSAEEFATPKSQRILGNMGIIGNIDATPSSAEGNFRITCNDRQRHCYINGLSQDAHYRVQEAAEDAQKEAMKQRHNKSL